MVKDLFNGMITEMVTILIACTNVAGKDGKIYAFRLLDFEGEAAENTIRSKTDCKEHKIEKTKGR